MYSTWVEGFQQGKEDPFNQCPQHSLVVVSFLCLSLFVSCSFSLVQFLFLRFVFQKKKKKMSRNSPKVPLFQLFKLQDHLYSNFRVCKLPQEHRMGRPAAVVSWQTFGYLVYQYHSKGDGDKGSSIPATEIRCWSPVCIPCLDVKPHQSTFETGNIRCCRLVSSLPLDGICFYPWISGFS